MALDYQNGESTKQTDPSRIEQRVVDYFASLGSPGENGSIDRTNDARVFLAKVDWQLGPKHLATLRYNYTWSEQANGTFDVDSWGVSANAVEKDDSNAITGSLISNLSSTLLNEFRFQWARENRPRPYDGPEHHRPEPAAARHRVRLRPRLPLRRAVLHPGRLLRRAHPVQRQHLARQGPPRAEVRRRVQPRALQPDLPRLPERPLRLRLDRRLPELRAQPEVRRVLERHHLARAAPARPAATSPARCSCSSSSSASAGSPPRKPAPRTSRRPSFAFFAQDKWQPNRNLTVSYGLRWEMQKQPDMITPASQVFYAPFIGQDGHECLWHVALPVERRDPFGHADVAAARRDLVGPQGRRPNGRPLNGGLFYGRVPGLALASSRSTNGSRAQNAFRASFFNGFGVTPPTYPNLLPAEAGQGVPDHPGVFVFDEDFQNPRTWQASASVEHEVVQNLAVLVQYNYAKGEHLTRFLEPNDSRLRLPVGHRHQRNERHRLRHLRRRAASPASSRRRRAATTGSPSGSPSATRATTSSR